MSELKNIHICALGGTIAMTADTGESGVSLSLTSEDLVAAVPSLTGLAKLTTHTPAQLASSNLTFSHASMVVDLATKIESQGADGIVITQGTDTLEEMAFILSLVWSGSIPIIFTAAMRHPASAGADGPANLLAAVQVATQAGRGVYVVMNNEVHDPSWVQKCHTSELNAFKSACGPIGMIAEGQVNFVVGLPHKSLVTIDKPQRVGLLSPALDDTPWQLEAAQEQGFDALVVASFGGGHVSEIWADALRPVAAKMPVVLASRVGSGRILTSTYGYKGAEIDLINAGLIPAGRLDARKARIVLSLADTFEKPYLENLFQAF